jgi:threonine aldolase
VEIDLRSDTVTRPDAGMRRAMADAEVGDDVFGDDPTVLALQERVARLLGKEAALFTPSGTMANQLALRSQTQPGDEILLDRLSHTLNNESGAAAALSGVQLSTLDSPPGGFGVAEIRGLRRPDHFSYPHTCLVEMENTHNGRGGEIFRLERMREVSAWARTEGLRLHLDGARLWNAHVATGVPLADYAACADTVSVCFSKGLGAPVGSALAGDAETIRRAHRFRKMLGGGMRQAGILAAGALYAIDHNLPRLAEDHRKAKVLERAVKGCAGLRMAHLVETNILIIEVVQTQDTPAAVVQALDREGVKASVWTERTLRLVTHLDAAMADVERVAEILQRIRG